MVCCFGKSPDALALRPCGAPSCGRSAELHSALRCSMFMAFFISEVVSRLQAGARVPGRGLVYRGERSPTGVVTPTVAEPPGRLRKEPARKGGKQTFDRRNTNGQ